MLAISGTETKHLDTQRNNPLFHWDTYVEIINQSLNTEFKTKNSISDIKFEIRSVTESSLCFVCADCMDLQFKHLSYNLKAGNTPKLSPAALSCITDAVVTWGPAHFFWGFFAPTGERIQSLNLFQKLVLFIWRHKANNSLFCIVVVKPIPEQPFTSVYCMGTTC